MHNSICLMAPCSPRTQGAKCGLGDDHPIASLSGAALTAEEVLCQVCDPGDDMALPGPDAEPPLEGAAARPRAMADFAPDGAEDRPAGLDVRRNIWARDAADASNPNYAYHLKCHYPQLKSCPTCCDGNSNIIPQIRRGYIAGLPSDIEFI